MTINDLIQKMSELPKCVRDKEFICFDVNNGNKLSVREDVSQFYVNGNDVVIYVQEKK